MEKTGAVVNGDPPLSDTSTSADEQSADMSTTLSISDALVGPRGFRSLQDALAATESDRTSLPDGWFQLRQVSPPRATLCARMGMCYQWCYTAQKWV